MRNRVLYLVVPAAFLVGLAAGALWKPVGMAFAQEARVGTSASAPGVTIEGGSSSRHWEVSRIADGTMQCFMIEAKGSGDPLLFECVRN